MSWLCDLHTHSSVSDGVLSPAELVSRAHRSGVALLALTDHDDIAGIAEASSRAEELGLELLPGIELSVSEEDGPRQMHILGLGIDPRTPLLLERVAVFRSRRRERARRIVERLNEMGVSIRFERVLEIGGEGSLGRPHVARALVEAGICSSSDEAFTRFLRRGRSAYVPSDRLDAGSAISLIHTAGGVASLAHPPRSLGVNAAGGLEAFVGRLVLLGLDALEVHHPSHKPREEKRLRRLVRTHGLVATGGSDFHGDERPQVEPGRGRSGLRLGHPFYAAVRDRLDERRQDAFKLTPTDPTGSLERLA